MAESDTEVVTREEVMFFDTDCGRVVHNLAYLRMIETFGNRSNWHFPFPSLTTGRRIKGTLY